MRKRIVWMGAAIAACALVFLLMSHKENLIASENATNASDDSAVVETRKNMDGTLKSGESSRLVAAYAPGVVVITNGVLEPDPRYNFNPGPNMPDSDGWERYRREMRAEASQGAKGKVTFHVVDMDGKNVAGAEIWAGFFGNPAVKGMTDAYGLFTSEGKTLHGASVSYDINKQGYYRTRAFYQLGKRGYRCLENGRWIPWNPTLRVTLKEIRKPIPMCLRHVSLPMPVRDQPVGFDFEAGEWVAPYGRGSSPDMQLTYTWTTGEDSWRRHDFTVEFTNSQDGAYMVQKDEYCPFMSEYEARQDTGYAKRFQYAYERTSDRIIQDSKLGEHDIIVFRVRTEADPQGKIVNARYGKIYGPFEFAQGREKLVRFTYYFNPTPNDPNLEFDGEHNLSDPRWHNPIEPR